MVRKVFNKLYLNLFSDRLVKAKKHATFIQEAPKLIELGMDLVNALI